MCLPCARTRGEGAPLPGLRAPLGSCATFARKRSQGQRVKDAPLPIPARLPFACRPAPKLGGEGGKAPLPGWRAAAGRVATSARCGGRKRGGGTASGFAPAPFASLLCAREDGRAHPHSRAGPRSAICTQTGAGGGAPLLCPRMVPPSPPGLRATLALRFATPTIRSASRFRVKGVRTPFPFTRAPSPVSATPVPARLHVADREHTEKKGGRGYAGKPRGCASKGRGRKR